MRAFVVRGTRQAARHVVQHTGMSHPIGQRALPRTGLGSTGVNRRWIVGGHHEGGGRHKADDDDSSDSAATTQEKPAKKQSIKSMARQYGPVFLVYWTGLWAASGVGLFAALEGATSAGLVDIETVLAYLSLQDHVSPTAGNVAVAVAVNEALEVVRFPFTVATTPRVARWWNDRRRRKHDDGSDDER